MTTGQGDMNYMQFRFNLETVTGKIYSLKDGFAFCVCRF